MPGYFCVSILSSVFSHRLSAVWKDFNILVYHQKSLLFSHNVFEILIIPMLEQGRIKQCMWQTLNMDYTSVVFVSGLEGPLLIQTVFLLTMSATFLRTTLPYRKLKLIHFYICISFVFTLTKAKECNAFSLQWTQSSIFFCMPRIIILYIFSFVLDLWSQKLPQIMSCGQVRIS